MVTVLIKVKQFLYRPRQDLRASGIPGRSEHEGGKFLSPVHRPILPPRRYSWCSVLLKAESNQGHSAAGDITSMKSPVILWKIGADIRSIYLRIMVVVRDVHLTVVYVMNEVSNSGLPGCDSVSLGK
jgi:hypothetical protein